MKQKIVNDINVTSYISGESEYELSLNNQGVQRGASVHCPHPHSHQVHRILRVAHLLCWADMQLPFWKQNLSKCSFELCVSFHFSNRLYDKGVFRALALKHTQPNILLNYAVKQTNKRVLVKLSQPNLQNNATFRILGIHLFVRSIKK
jgi:hypothetical protein